MSKLYVTTDIVIDESELEETFVLASGPGGQNVNKVSSAVQLRFNAAFSLSLPEPVRFRLMKLAGRRLTKDGVLVLTSRQFRDQTRNRADVRERLATLIRAAAIEPKRRRTTKPPRAAKEKRLRHKKKHAELKRARSRPHSD
ncbi:MAG: aminoacyl-tRNA hydrolase [Alphaproteobacteria bacterium]|nr:aminoacyl-tRNA hydrolase [Alphaproteobacteria bacterium]MDE1986383.1 aminoacyl-tRNA hydrolase [Alphaproteobacteria bacterium]MDE2162125.1 aminoacyl-tRNA hydrolase [Alphaproteobacteria bacterium]MDE2499871.1 aminoacyl-tRNA hydrolase [Alphaproteobacteria bacterium]